MGFGGRSTPIAIESDELESGEELTSEHANYEVGHKRMPILQGGRAPKTPKLEHPIRSEADAMSPLGGLPTQALQPPSAPLSLESMPDYDNYVKAPSQMRMDQLAFQNCFLQSQIAERDAKRIEQLETQNRLLQVRNEELSSKLADANARVNDLAMEYNEDHSWFRQLTNQLHDQQDWSEALASRITNLEKQLAATAPSAQPNRFTPQSLTTDQPSHSESGTTSTELLKDVRMRIGITCAVEPTHKYSLIVDDIPPALAQLARQAAQEFEKKASNYERTLRSVYRCAWTEHLINKAYWTKEDRGLYACKTCFNQRRVCLVPTRVDKRDCFVIVPVPPQLWPEFSREDDTLDPTDPAFFVRTPTSIVKHGGVAHGIWSKTFTLAKDVGAGLWST